MNQREMIRKTQMENIVREAYAKGLFNGTWLCTEKGKIISKGALGFRDPDGLLPLNEDSVFEIASVSKQFTATAVMLLYKKGLLGLDDELSKYFPENPYKGVTIRHLLTHTGGIPDHETWAKRTIDGERLYTEKGYCTWLLRDPSERFDGNWTGDSCDGRLDLNGGDFYLSGAHGIRPVILVNI